MLFGIVDLRNFFFNRVEYYMIMFLLNIQFVKPKIVNIILNIYEKKITLLEICQSLQYRGISKLYIYIYN